MTSVPAPRQVLIGALLLGLLIRAALLVWPPAESTFWDHHEYVQWGRITLDRGVTAVYSVRPPNVPAWNHATGKAMSAWREDQPFCNYPPMGVYVVYAEARVLDAITPKYMSNTSLARTAFSIPSVLADVASAGFGFMLVRRWKGAKAAAWCAAVIFLLPPLFLDSAWWTQTDSWVIAAFMGCLVALLAGRVVLAGVALGMGLALKTQGVLFLPVLLFGMFMPRFRVPMLKAAAVAVVVLNLAALPFWLTSGPLWFQRSYAGNLADMYPHTTLAAFNIWYADLLLGGDGYARAEFGGLTKDTWGRLLLGASLLGTAVVLLRRKLADEDRLMRFAACLLLLAVMLATRVHERYIVLSLPVLAVVMFGSIPRLAWAFVPLVAGATLQITSHEWLPEGIQQWQKITTFVTRQYEDLRRALPPEEFAKLPPPSEKLAEAGATFGAARDQGGVAAREWGVTWLCLGSAVWCVGLMLAGRGSGPTDEHVGCDRVA